MRAVASGTRRATAEPACGRERTSFSAVRAAILAYHLARSWVSWSVKPGDLVHAEREPPAGPCHLRRGRQWFPSDANEPNMVWVRLS